MLETSDLDKELAQAEYDKRFRPLRDELDDLQRAIRDAKIPVIIVLEGWDAAGKGDTIEKMVGRLDPRGYKVHAVFEPTPEEARYPFLWRFWTRIPGRGEIAIFDRSWYRRVLQDRVEKTVKKREWQAAFAEIAQFERQLADDGAVIVKFWLHISEKEQRRRFKNIEESRFDRWRISKQDWKAHRQYEKYLAAAEEMLARTSTAYAPWTIVEATDKKWRRIKVFETLAEAMKRAIESKASAAAPPKAPARRPATGRARSIIDQVDLSKSLTPKRYGTAIVEGQVRLRELHLRCYDEKRPVVICYEGWDAGGKGGNIRRVIGCLDPRGYAVHSIAAPKGDEATHHYLWRFWTRLPKSGHFAIFDRTWYGRALVERVEGFCAEAEWRRAYQEINEFEQQLTRYGMIIVKFWLHISKEEQLRRFKERQETDYKRYKITDEDWRNREKWDDYRMAVADMLTHTSTAWAPWTVVEANDKLWARIRALRAIIAAIEKAL